MAAHNFRHERKVGRSVAGGIHRRLDLAEIGGTEKSWRRYHQHLRVFSSEVVEPVNGSPGDAQRLPRSDLDCLTVDCPRQNAAQAVNRFLESIMTVGRGAKLFTAWDGELEDRRATAGIFRSDQEPYLKRSDPDHFVGGIDGRR